jgi:hypothetical protein
MYQPKSMAIFIAVALILGSRMAWAQDAGTLPSTDGLINSTAQGAIYNQDQADRLFSESRDHEHEYRHHHDGNLLAKALNEARQAVTAETQAKQMANSALGGLQSASTQQNQTSAAESQIDQAALLQIANEQSALAQEMADTFAGYGYNIGSDQGASGVDATGTPVPAATAGATTTSAADSRAPAAVASTTIIQGATGSGATTAAASGQTGLFPGLATPASALPPNGKLGASGLNGSDPSAILAAGGGGGANSAAASKKEFDPKKALLNHRAKILAQTAKQIKNPDGSVDMIRPASDDIFTTVHAHYDNLSETGLFFGDHLPNNNAEALQAAAVTHDRQTDYDRRSAVLKQVGPAPPRLLPFASRQ